MNYDWPTFLASIGSSVVVGLGAAYAIVQTFFKKKIEAEVQSKYDEALANLNAKNLQELEGFKAGYKKVLDENQIRYSKLYAEQADAVKELYKRLNELQRSLVELTGSLTKTFRDIKKQEEYFNQKGHNATKTYDHCMNYLAANEILIPETISDNVWSFLKKSSKTIHLCNTHPEQFINTLTTHETEAYKMVDNDLMTILRSLRESFRAILNGEEVQSAK